MQLNYMMLIFKYTKSLTFSHGYEWETGLSCVVRCQPQAAHRQANNLYFVRVTSKSCWISSVVYIYYLPKRLHPFGSFSSFYMLSEFCLERIQEQNALISLIVPTVIARPYPELRAKLLPTKGVYIIKTFLVPVVWTCQEGGNFSK